MKGLLTKIGVCLVIFALLCGFYFFTFRSKSNHTEPMGLSYFEDTTGQMGIRTIKNAALNGEFVETNDSSFTFGRSHSTFWIRIPTENPELLKDYIALFCPNIQNVQLYIPTGSGYEVHDSGWANSPSREDEGLTYPVFRWSPKVSGGDPIYMRIQSCYSHNYTLEFYTQKELNRVRTTDFCLSSFFFGMLITIVIINLIIFLKLKNKTCLSFSICVLLLSLHQGISYGMYNIIMPAHSYVLMSLSIEIGLLFIISIIIFFIVFLNIKAYSRFYYRCLLLLIGACLIDYPINLMDKVAANFYGHLLSIIVPLFILYIFFRLHGAGHKDQRMFLLGWGLMILLYVATTLVCEGVIQMAFLAVHLPEELIVMVAVSIIFSVALIERAKQMEIDRLKMQNLYQAAAERVKKTETALMQTQIKPHFLYNTLTAIEQLCQTDSLKAQAAIANFADYLRSNIDFSVETRLMLIEKELENVKHYLSLEQMRFEERLQVVYDIQAGGFMLPPLVVQPMVENAVRHGVTKKPEGGTVTITVGETGTAYTIIVADDGVGFEPDSAVLTGCRHIGISNVRERLARMCRGTLKISSELGVGTTVTISIPKEAENESDRG